MTADLPRIGQVPECEHPKCRLDGITKTHEQYPHIVCSLHAEWASWMGEAHA